MPNASLDSLVAFLAVARERSFTRAAARLGVTPSAISHAMRGLEARLDVRLLSRTTRSVSLTEAGERLFRAIAPRFDEIEAELGSLTAALRNRPAGTVRITCSDNVLTTVLWPKLAPVLREHPDVHVEFDVSYELKDIVAERFDAGVRLGDQVEKDMVAVPIGPKLRMAAVASPAYFAAHRPPTTPKQLADHRCINLRLPTYGGLYVWEFARRGTTLNVRVDGQLVFNTAPHVIAAALDGFGIAFLPDDEVLAQVAAGRLTRVLQDWCPPFAGYHLYYPSRRQPSPAFVLVLEALRHRETGTR